MSPRFLRLGYESFAVVQAFMQEKEWKDGVLLVDTFSDNKVIWKSMDDYEQLKATGTAS